MSFDDTINAYFVTTSCNSDESCKEDIDKALACLRNHISDEHIRQIKASEGFPLIASGQLTKKDVFVFDRFEGDFFQQLQLTKSLIIGPRCLITCLMRCVPIPLGTSPVYTTAMRDLHISATGITPHKKEQLRVLIQWMGGHYFQNFGRSVTHLISNTVKSTKYEHATLNGIPVMHVDWVERVWERSCVDDIAATDDEFNKYRLPIFFGTNITCTGLDTDKKNEVMRLVNENGGSYHSAFRSQLVDVVITEKNKTNSEKYKAAVRYKKDILLPEWIFDSVHKGFALPTKAYQVKPLKVSTPTRDDQSIANFTQLSDISRISVAAGKGVNMNSINESACSVFNETQQGEAFLAPPPPQMPAPSSAVASTSTNLRALHGAGTNYRTVYDEICPKQAKKAGNFLDGCCVYLSGFRSEEKEKLNRILNVGGATRYDVVNEKITHIIVGQLDNAEFNSWKRDNLLNVINIVRLDWLLESIKLKQPASEIVYRMSIPTAIEPDAPSPSSKRTLRSMNHSFKQPDLPIKKKLFENTTNDAHIKQLSPPKSTITEINFEEDEHNLIAQYSQEYEPAAVMPPPVATKATTNKTQCNNDSTMSHPPVASSTQIILNNEKTTNNRPSVAPVAAAPLPNQSEMTDVGTIDYEHLDFFEGMSVYIDREHFPEEFYTQMISECEAAQGNVVADTYKDTVDYAIVSFERTLNPTRLPVKARHVITELYVESCLKQNKIVPVEYYHKHIPHTANPESLEGMIIVISIYTGLERDFIESVAMIMGAKLNKTFMKKERPLLVCPSAEGSKYEAAIKWGYPVVTSEWLVQCAVKGEKLPYEHYLVGDSAHDFATSPASHTLRERNVTVQPLQPTDMDAMENNVHNIRQSVAGTSMAIEKKTAEGFTPLRNKRVSELAGPTRSVHTPDSPHTPPNNYARASYDFDFMESILAEIENEAERECLREVIIEMRNNQTPELERIRRQACTPINRKIPTPKGIPDFCTTPEFEKRMADEFERRWRLPTKKLKPDTPIDEIRRRVMRATCKALGISFSDDDEQATSTSKLKSITLTARQTMDATTTTTTPTQHQQTLRNSTGLVAPRSIFANQRMSKTPNASNSTPSDTGYIPDTQTPVANNVSPHLGLGQRISVLRKSSIDFDKITFDDTTLASVSGAGHSSSAAAASSPEIKQITDYLKNCESRRRSLKRSHDHIDQQTECDDAMETDDAHYVQPFESEQFGAGTEDMVGWRDPVEFVKERGPKVVPAMHYKGTPQFSVSCTDIDMRQQVIEKILKLGGRVSENLVNFDPDCTHFICERPNRGEKMIGCISSGKWVLSLNYIEECFSKDAFIDEELYEWGNCKAIDLPQLKQDEQVIAQAAHYWRKRLNDTGIDEGAFTGFRALLHISERSLSSMQNIIKAGKGQVVEATPPYNKCPNVKKLVTHCFVDIKKRPLSKEDLEHLNNCGIKVYQQMYINAYLMNGGDVDTDKYEIKINGVEK